MNPKLTKKELKTIHELSKKFMDRDNSKFTQLLSYQTIKSFWKLVEIKYHLQARNIIELRPSGLMVIK